MVWWDNKEKEVVHSTCE